MWVIVMGWLAGLVGSLLAVPQLVRILRTRETAGLSLLSWQITVAVCASWAIHGARGGMVNMLLPNTVLACVSVPVMVLIHRARRLPAGPVWATVCGLAAVCIAVDLFTTPVIFGVVIVIPQSVAALTQLRDMHRSADVSGVSPVFLLQNVVVQSLWLIWGSLAGEVSVIIAAALTGALWAVNAVFRQFRYARTRTMTA